MKKTIKSLCDIINVNKEFIGNQREKDLAALAEQAPKVVLLSCSYPLRFMGEGLKNIYPVTNYGGILQGNEVTLDYAIKTLEIPVLIIMGHEECSAVKGSLKGEGNTEYEKNLFAAIAPSFAEGKARKFRDNIMKHIDYQVSLALERYRLLIKTEKLAVIGMFCDGSGHISISNYNGLRGLDSLYQALPDVDPSLFLE